MDTFSVLTIQLARIYGIVALTVALAALLAPRRMGLILDDFERSPAITFIGALFALILGLVMVMVHNLWTDFGAILVSLFGWIVLIKGILLLAAPEGLLRFATASGSSPARIRLWGVAALVLAALFLVIGLASRATTVSL
ncbi:MAG TPA: hypothetical protein VFV70_05355 [Hyphomonadaceae bacterium]|nr:hypothetical protein [Hyphomonadaceae bacterium]